MIIIGIDPGTRITGYGVIKVEGSRYQAIDFGTIRPPANLDLADKYLYIFNGVDELIKKYEPEAVAVETQYIQKNVQSAMKLGMARGAIIVATRRRGVEIHEYSPSKAKLAVVGNGRASKEQVQGMIQRLLGLSEIPEPEDAADALALAICLAQDNRKKNLATLRN